MPAARDRTPLPTDKDKYKPYKSWRLDFRSWRLDNQYAGQNNRTHFWVTVDEQSAEQLRKRQGSLRELRLFFELTKFVVHLSEEL